MSELQTIEHSIEEKLHAILHQLEAKLQQVFGSQPVRVPEKKRLPSELSSATDYYNDGWNDAIDEMISIPPHPQQAVPDGWISVQNRLPEPDVSVLVHNGKWTGVGAWCGGPYIEDIERWQDERREFIELNGPAVTHWMPLPAAPAYNGNKEG